MRSAGVILAAHPPGRQKTGAERENCDDRLERRIQRQIQVDGREGGRTDQAADEDAVGNDAQLYDDARQDGGRQEMPEGVLDNVSFHRGSKSGYKDFGG